MSNMNRNSKKSQVGNRKAGSRNNKVLLSKKEFSALPKKQRQSMMTRPLGANSTSVAAAYSSPVKPDRPKIVYGKNGRSVRIVHKEFVQNVTGTTIFTVATFLALNPGLSATFPWLANIANNFEQYRCHRLRLCYLTRTGTNIPGSVIIAPDYDASDAQPGSEQILSNYSEVVEDAPWKDICCELRPSGMHALGPRKFVRNAQVPGQDPKTTDVGTAILATVDGTAVSWGKLWIEYDFEFFEPQLNPQGSGLASTAQGSAGTTTNFISVGSVIAGSLISGTAGNVISLQNLLIGGEYFLGFGQTVTAATLAFSAFVGITEKTALLSGTQPSGVTFTATANVGSITMTWSSNATTPFVCVSPISIGTI